jgi:O-antigen/teichoic acid export membrane protein
VAAERRVSADTRPLGRDLRRSAAWSTVDVAVGRLGQFAQGVIVARILAPEEFGVFAVALVVHAIVVNVSELGVSAALIRDDRDLATRSAPTVAMISFANSAAIAVVMAASSPLLAHLLGSPAAAGPIAVMSLTLPLAGLSAVPSAFLRRDFRMDRIFVSNLSRMILTGAVVVPLALADWGPLALAWSWVAGQVVATAILLCYKPGRFWPGWDYAQARRLLRFGLPLAGANVMGFFVLNVDYIVVGRALGAEALGLYMLAFNISGWPLNVFGTVIRSISLPGFSRLQLDGQAMPEHFVRALRLVAGIGLPVCFIIGALAEPAVEAVYGTRWGEAATALVGLCVLGAGRIILELAGDYLVTLGRTRAVFFAQLPWTVALVTALLLLVPDHGIAGAGAAQALTVTTVMIPAYGWLLRRSGVGLLAMARALLEPLLWALAAAAAAHLTAMSIHNDFLACAAGGTVGLVIAVIPFAPAILRAVTRRRQRRVMAPVGEPVRG